MSYTRDDFEIAYSVADWGSPAAHITLTGGRYAGEVFRLRSAKGIKEATRRSEWGYHLDKVPAVDEEYQSTFAWYGSYESDDLETCIDELVVDLNLWLVDEEDRWKIADAAGALRSCLDRIDETDIRRGDTKRVRDQWAQAREAFWRVEMALFRPPVAPTPPLTPWAAPLAWLGHPDQDGRLIRPGSSFPLAKPVPLFDAPAGHGLQETLGSIDRLEVDDSGRLWAFGFTGDPELARQLSACERFASMAIDARDFHHENDLFIVGGAIRVLGAAVQGGPGHPWSASGSWAVPDGTESA
jgi:hypothetical protein